VFPQQNNDNVEDEVAAEIVWKQSKLQEDSIIVDLFRVSVSASDTAAVAMAKVTIND